MGRVRTSCSRSRVPWHRRAFLDPVALRYWLAVTVAALVLTAAVQRSLATAEALRDRWGPMTEVVVTTEAVRAGDPLAPASSTVRWPRSLAPPDALTATPGDGRAAADLDPGTPVTPALVRDGERARSQERHLGVEAADPGLEPGDRVDVWATNDPILEVTPEAPDPDGARRIASTARVVRAADGRVVLAVTPEEVADVAQAASLGILTLVIVP